MRKITDRHINQLEEICAILKNHVGKENAIYSKEISKELGLPMEDTQYTCRQLITEVTDKFRVPVLACPKGYYIASSQAEVDEYLESLEKRINGLLARKNGISANWEMYGK